MTVSPIAGLRLVNLANGDLTADALSGIEASSRAGGDFNLIEDYWDTQAQLQQALERNSLESLNAEIPTNTQSGNQTRRLSLPHPNLLSV